MPPTRRRIIRKVAILAGVGFTSTNLGCLNERRSNNNGEQHTEIELSIPQPHATDITHPNPVITTTNQVDTGIYEATITNEGDAGEIITELYSIEEVNEDKENVLEGPFVTRTDSIERNETITVTFETKVDNISKGFVVKSRPNALSIRVRNVGAMGKVGVSLVDSTTGDVKQTKVKEIPKGNSTFNIKDADISGNWTIVVEVVED